LRISALIAADMLLPALVGLLVIAGCSGEDNGEKATVAADGATTAAMAVVPVGKGFDSLSWSPSWCVGNDPTGKTDQCERGDGHGLIVHGLWPQYEKGYPQFCQTRQPDRVPETLARQYLDLIPSMGLIGHQWRKHGACSGLSQGDYFAVARAARERLAVPPELASAGEPRDLSVSAIEAAFAAKNPGMTQDMIAVTCEGRLLEEIRICFDKELNFRACPEVDSRACGRGTVLVPPAP
jgi:ribonuclease T2